MSELEIAGRLDAIAARLTVIDGRLAAIEGRLSYMQWIGTMLFAGLLASYAGSLTIALKM